MAESAGTNWAGNYAYRASGIVHPASVEEIQSVVRRAANGGTRVRALGTRHCFNDIADTTGELIAMTALPPRFELDENARAVTVSGGTRYGDFAEQLDARGFALANLASLPHISVAGATQTGTHGSGVGHRPLSSQVVGLHLVDPAGADVVLGPDDPDFDAVVVGLGAFGVVHRVELATVPAFTVEQRVHVGLGWDALLPRFHDVLACAYSVSVFTRFDDAGPTRLELAPSNSCNRQCAMCNGDWSSCSASSTMASITSTGCAKVPDWYRCSSRFGRSRWCNG